MTAKQPLRTPPWIPLSTSLSFLLRTRSLLAWSAGLTVATMVLTWLGFSLTTDLIDTLTGSFFTTAPSHDTWLGWIKYSSWVVASKLFLFVSRVISFFISFLLAYTLTSPFYAFLSTAAERRYLGKEFRDDDGLNLLGVVTDLYEGFKIALFGLIITIVALAIGFVPLFGQLAVLLLYACYATLMFIDYPASRRRWSLLRKLQWLWRHVSTTLRLGLLPAVIGMVPLFNTIIMALLFPLFTVHAAINFAAIEYTDDGSLSKTTPRRP